MTITLIVNADDFGLTEGVNKAVLACHLAGSVTSTTLMANMDAAEHAAGIARQHRSLGVGLHFNLTCGRPILPSALVPSLVNGSGEFFARRELIKRALCGKVRSEHIEAELRAQWNRSIALGIQPTHVDSHQHVHAIFQIFDVLTRSCAIETVPLRLTWRWPGRVAHKSLHRRLSESVLQVMTRRCVARKPVAVVTNDGLCSVFDLNVSAEFVSEASYEQLLDAYHDGVVELMVHPAEVDDALKAKTQITHISAMENRLLRSGFLRDYIHRRQGRMASYANVGLAMRAR